MESKRQQKFSRLMQRELSEVFQKDTMHLFDNNFITITSVRVSPDLRIAKVYLSLLLAKNKDNVLMEVELQTKTIRQFLAKRIRNQVRVIPELHFYLDDTYEYAEKIDKLLDGLDIPPEEEEEN